MRLSITILPIILIFSACRKNDKPIFDGKNCSGNCYILTGRITEFQTKAPLSNTELKLYYRPAGYAIFFDPTKYLGNTNTASDGSYSFKFDSKNFRNPTGYFLIKGNRKGYVFKNSGDKTNNELLLFYLDSSKINVPQVNDLALYKEAVLKFRIRASTITNFEFLTVTYSYGTNGYGPVLNGDRVIDTTLFYKTAADIPTYINWNALGNGVSIDKRDTVIVTSGTEKTYEINL